VSDLQKCPRCKAAMDEVVTIAPIVHEPGLIGYECPACHYVTSVLWHPEEPGTRE
jgi:transposase-like protein